MCSAKIINRLIKLKHCKFLSESDLRVSSSAVLTPLPVWLSRLRHFIVVPSGWKRGNHPSKGGGRWGSLLCAWQEHRSLTASGHELCNYEVCGRPGKTRYLWWFWHSYYLCGKIKSNSQKLKQMGWFAAPSNFFPCFFSVFKLQIQDLCIYLYFFYCSLFDIAECCQYPTTQTKQNLWQNNQGHTEQ